MFELLLVKILWVCASAHNK